MPHMAKTSADLLPGTLDMLILKAVSLKPLHGYGVLLRIAQISKDVLDVPQGSLYPALYRLGHGLILRSTRTNVHPRTHVMIVGPPGASTSNSKFGARLGV